MARNIEDLVKSHAQVQRRSRGGRSVRLSLVVFAALLGLVSITTGGKFRGVSVDYLAGEFVERMIQGFRPRR